MENIPYTVETYTMNPGGEYTLVTTAHTGTTDETVTAEYTVPEGVSYVYTVNRPNVKEY